MTCPPVSPMMERDLQSCPPENRYILPVEEWMNYDWYKVVIRDKPERLVWLRRELRREMGDDTFEDTMSGPTFFELQKKGAPRHS